MDNTTSIVERVPLSESAASAALVRPWSVWSAVRVIDETESTMDDVVQAAEAGEPEGLIVVAEFQTSGRGRMDRHWISPPRAGLTFSILLKPHEVPVARWSFVPLLAGLALQHAIGRVCGISAKLKWPNDLLLGSARRKSAGILVRAAGNSLVVGIGVNVTNTRTELPTADATSLVLENSRCLDRDMLLREILTELEQEYRTWRLASGDASHSGLIAAYTAVCDTVGRYVHVVSPTGRSHYGLARGIDPLGQLLIEESTGEYRISAGEVVHLR